MSVPSTQVDLSALRTNQAAIILLSMAAFIFNVHWLVALVGALMLFGTLRSVPAFAFFYRYWLKPLGWLASDIIPDHPQPHRFAQGFGALVMLAGAAMLYAGSSLVGWLLVWLVIALAALNLFAGFCVGCALYYWLNRLQVPGFNRSPLPRTEAGKPIREKR